MLTVARRLQRLVRPVAAGARRCSTRSSCTTASRPASTWRWSTRRTSIPYMRDRRRGARARRRPGLQPPAGRAAAAHRALRLDADGGRVAGSRRSTSSRASPVDERIHQKILHRVKDGIEDDIDEALDQRGARENDEAVDLLNNVLLPAMKDVGDRFGARRADPAVRAAVRRGDEEGGRATRALPRPHRGPDEGQGRAGHGVRRRARHRQEPRQHDPLQQRLHASTTWAGRCRST